ncbi:hypothetical protein, conserved [Angomonas deanei]|uniref:PUM-HD domain-containing protein n=1 Tax=Angomonas deanei TaxID=59799 RepID=A0A7G2CUS7_9TRYP|nr:hypothetical protein, conserved [Angomonas deanei]
MMQRATSPEELRSLLMNRHTSGTVEHLLRYLPAPTSNWLCAVLFGEEEELTAAQRQELVEDPVAGQILQQIAQTQLQLRGRLLQLFSPVELLHTKRGTAFLNVLLSAPEPDSKVDKKELRLVFDTVRKQIVSKLEEMCADRNANFVVQRLLQLIPFCAEDPKAMVTQFVKDMGGADALVRLAAEPIGVHVVLTLIDVAVACGAGDEVGSLLLKRVSPEEMIAHNQGQLVVRRLLPLVAVKRSAVGTELSTLLSNKWVDYAFDSMGNLVVQDYLKALGTAGASKCAATLVKDTNLLRMSQNASASHVVFTLLDLVDGPTQTSLCNALKGVVVQLSTHINGRFIVEKLLRLSREVRDELVKQFLFLVQSKGTQHMLCTLLTCIDGRGRQHVIQGIIVPNLMAIATDASGSVNLQKMMQSDAEVLQAVQKAISATGARTPLLQNFFGKFVVRIAEGGQ